MSNVTSKPIKELCEFVTPEQWKDWLNEIQATVIRSGALAGYSKEAFSEFGDNFLYLQRFFSAIQAGKTLPHSPVK